MRPHLLTLAISSLVFLPSLAMAAVSLSVSPAEPIQGEPLMILILGTTTPSNVQGISFDGKPLRTFQYAGQPTAFYGINLNKKPGSYEISAVLKDGTVLEKDLVIEKRERVEMPLGIPQKLGGDTPASQSNLVSTLAIENASFLNLRTGNHAFWTEKFIYPLTNPVITDTYGYSRKTGSYSIAHKGVDLRADEGTRVLAMNRGVVRVVREYRNYGKTVIVDHGLGLMTFYMHLSKIYVNVGELVMPGQLIGLSGQTGYAEEPHLHLTVRINDISIDPVKFLGLFK